MTILNDNEWFKESNELGKKFFDRWSILSGGTFTLFIPFIQSLNGFVSHKSLLIFIEILLVISLLSSSLHPWIASRISYENAFPNKRLRINLYARIQKVNHIISIFSYIIAVILILFFINFNIF